jgi:hypothetical protein
VSLAYASVAAAWLALTYVALSSGWLPVSGEVRTEAPHDISKRLVASEPSVGTAIVLPEHDAYGERYDVQDGNLPILFVFGGSCTECSVATTRIARINPDRYAAIIVGFTDVPPGGPPAAHTLGNAVVVSLDGTDIPSVLNTLWAPRYYLLSGEGRILGAQTAFGEIPEWVHFVGEEVKQ